MFVSTYPSGMPVVAASSIILLHLGEATKAGKCSSLSVLAADSWRPKKTSGLGESPTRKDSMRFSTGRDTWVGARANFLVLHIQEHFVAKSCKQMGTPKQFQFLNSFSLGTQGEVFFCTCALPNFDICTELQMYVTTYWISQIKERT